MTSARETTSQFELRRRQFLTRTQNEPGFPDIARFLWYHTIELGGGLVTPGLYDYRDTFDEFHFPSDLKGKTVLDIGSATGFFAFEFERRGAIVTSVELASLENLDRFPGQTVEEVLAKIKRMMFADQHPLSTVWTAEEMYWYLLEGPFRFCSAKLNSKLRRCYATIYDLCLTALHATEPFDLVFAGDVLLHTLDPFRALTVLAPLAKERLVIAQAMPELLGRLPALVYVGGDNPLEDEVSWWHPTAECFVQLLKKLGFRHVAEMAKHRGVLMPAAFPFERTVLHALR